MAELPLARDFPAADEADWKALVEQALKGAPFASLRSETYDGIVVEPLYARAGDAPVIPARAPGTPWAVMQRIDLADGAAANAQILDDLDNGASGFTLVFSGAVGDYGFALPASEDVVARALDGVELDAGIDLELEFGPPSRQAAEILARYVATRGTDPSRVKLRFGFDPLGALATLGATLKPWTELAPAVVGSIRDLAAKGFTGPFAVADGRPVHGAGGSEAQELAFALANALAYLRALEHGGIPLDDARRLIYFRLAADQNQFLTTAKFRSLRKLWSRIEEACGLEPDRAFVAAETAWRMMTKRDPHGNIVRGTIAALGAAVGGANAISVLPFSAALGLPDSFARRVARNTQLILLEEANLYRVADPAAGAGAIEALTGQLCAAAWKFFQAIESAGGTAEALRAGLIQRAVAKVRAERETNAAERVEPLVGTSDFPDLAEEPVAVLDAAPSMTADTPGTQNVELLPRMRIAEPFEALRDLSDAYLAAHGSRPKVFLACLGRPADFNARASFAKSLFEAGGLETIEGRGDNLVKRFAESGATLACLCSSDKVYASDGAEAARTLTAAGAEHVYVAGRPGALEQDLRAAGVECFVYTGGDTLAVLREAHATVALKRNYT